MGSEITKNNICDFFQRQLGIEVVDICFINNENYAKKLLDKYDKEMKKYHKKIKKI